MTTDGNRPIEACLIDVFRHLGIERVHIAAGQQGGGDWLGLATHYAERVATLSLVSRARRRTGCVAMSTCSGPMSWPIAVRR